MSGTWKWDDPTWQRERERAVIERQANRLLANDRARQRRQSEADAARHQFDGEAPALVPEAPIEADFGLDHVAQIVITRTAIGAIYSDDSDRSFVQWRSEDDACCGHIPSPPRSPVPAPSVNATDGQLEALGMAEFNHHYDDGDPRHCDRNPFEHPERAFRRAFQQGAHRVLDALQEARVLDPDIERRVYDYVYDDLYHWRYAKRRGLGRRLNVDCAPWLDLSPRRR